MISSINLCNNLAQHLYDTSSPSLLLPPSLPASVSPSLHPSLPMCCVALRFFLIKTLEELSCEGVCLSLTLGTTHLLLLLFFILFSSSSFFFTFTDHSHSLPSRFLGNARPVLEGRKGREGKGGREKERGKGRDRKPIATSLHNELI